MLKFVQMGCVIVGMLFLAGCATTRVLSDYDQSVDFSKFKTFNWLAEPSQADALDGVRNTIVHKRFKRHIKEILENKKYRMNTSTPDFYVSYNTNVREREAVSYANGSCFPHWHHYGYHRRHYHHFGYAFHGGYSTYIYDEATITIDIIDARTNELVWRGWTSKRSYGPSLPDTYIREAVIDILSRFPPIY